MKAGAVILIVIVILGFAYWFHKEPIVNDSEDSDDTYVPPPTLDTNTNICNAYTDNFPAYFEQKRIQCGLAGGNWKCESDIAGCFNIPLWDAGTMCFTQEINGLRAMCASMGGQFTCDADEVGCTR